LEQLRIVTLLFDRFTALDVVGPYEVLSRIPGARFFFAADEQGIYKDPYGLRLHASLSISEITAADILLIPGGYGVDDVLKNSRVIDWIRSVDDTTTWTTSVCSGSLLLAEAGLLDGKPCTTHWRRKNQLRLYPVQVVDERYVHADKYITSAGVSAGIDMAIYLAAQILGDARAIEIQHSIEYDPKPPFDLSNLLR
jgi:transcriptional regulator GlxA family with amidase domain